MGLHVVYRDSERCDRLVLLPDPLTGRPATLGIDAALGIVRLLASHGVEAGVVAAAPPAPARRSRERSRARA